MRSSTRRYPYDEEPVEGLVSEDIDGDGMAGAMRQQDPEGELVELRDEHGVPQAIRLRNREADNLGYWEGE